jgi:hypothetical protein
MNEQPKEPIRNRIKKYIANNQVNERFKTHFEKHKIKYAVGTTVVVTTGVNWAIFALMRKNPTPGTTLVTSTNNDGHHNTINNIENLHIYYKRVTKYGNPVGRPGTKVIDLTDLNVYDSYKRLMADLNISYYDLMKHLNGKTPDVNGHVIMTCEEHRRQLQAAVELREALRRQELGY